MSREKILKQLDSRDASILISWDQTDSGSVAMVMLQTTQTMYEGQVADLLNWVASIVESGEMKIEDDSE